MGANSGIIIGGMGESGVEEKEHHRNEDAVVGTVEACEEHPGTLMEVPADSSARAESRLSPVTDEEEAVLAALLALDDSPPEMVAKALVVWRRARAARHSDIEANDDSSYALVIKAEAVLRAWRGALLVGSKVDVRSWKDQYWYAASIKDYNRETNQYLIKYDLFCESHNEWHTAGAENADIMPYRAETHKIRRPKRERAQEEVQMERVRLESKKQKECHSFFQEEAKVVATTRSGRSVKSVHPVLASPGQTSPKRRKVVKQAGIKAPAKAEVPKVHKNEMAEVVPSTFAVDTGGTDLNDWTCAECDQLERDDSDDRLVLCDGPCKRSFHQSCLGITKAEVDALETWLCDQCLEGEHACFICGDVGKDNTADGVHKCSKACCGKFYHQHCAQQMRGCVILKMQHEEGSSEQDVTLLEGQEDFVDHANRDHDQQPFLFKFICGRHVCDACGRGWDGVKARGQLFDCLKCPRSYHEHCIPPSCKYHDYVLLCPEHRHLDLPRLSGPPEPQTEVFVGKRGDGWLTQVISSLPLPRTPPLEPKDVGHFRLQSRLFDEVHSKPPPYTHIPTLRYVCKVWPKEPGPECTCQGVCGENCLNRVLHIECVGGPCSSAKGDDGSAPTGLSKRSQASSHHNCNVGPNCKNRAFQKKEFVKYELFREHGRGWGLKTMEDVKKGQLVFEYAGEVIDEEMLQERLEAHAKEHPNDNNTYFMELESGYFLDARYKANPSRFINHSCEPNCELQKWNVKGMTHIGIMALRDIPAGSPLSYDYQFDRDDAHKFKCYCGSLNCRGSLAKQPDKHRLSVPKLDAVSKNNKNERMRVAELQRKRERREQARMEVQYKKRSLTSHLLPGDQTLQIKCGPPPRWFRFVKETHLFLLRNLRHGNDWISRRAALQCRVADAMKKGDTHLNANMKSATE